ncbi:MAG: phosphoesterase, partial [Gammaproteobacteria bacterium]|nr:phosphoesterase [Gammaproteobacteria bacterium]
MPASSNAGTSATRRSQPTGSPLPDAHPGRQTLLQLTDPHLYADPQGQLLGVTTRRSFEAVLALALARAQPAQALVLTGDLVHDESPEGYRALRRLLDRTGLPYYCIPGNHDSHRPMRDLLGPAALMPTATRTLGGWNLVFLDSTEPGRESGRLGHARRVSLEHA